jgi:hypothetical protein
MFVKIESIIGIDIIASLVKYRQMFTITERTDVQVLFCEDYPYDWKLELNHKTKLFTFSKDEIVISTRKTRSPLIVQGEYLYYQPKTISLIYSSGYCVITCIDIDIDEYKLWRKELHRSKEC